MPIQPSPCRTCPFEGEEPIQLEPESLARYYKNLITFQSSHLCHSANNNKICRGGRNIQLRIMCRKNIIEAPTDEAFTKAMNECKGDQDSE
jgi:hypothetical protein